jgi:hypothetical protein
MDDLISRQAAIDALDKCHCSGKDENGRPWIYKENAVEAIEMVEPSPTAEPELIKCDYVKACNEVTMNKTFSALGYLAMLNDFEEYGYVLVKRRG